MPTELLHLDVRLFYSSFTIFGFNFCLGQENRTSLNNSAGLLSIDHNMANVEIKVSYDNQTKTFRFSSELLVEEALKEIKERFFDESGLSFGLFQPATKTKKARWLKNNRTLKFYGITNGVWLFIERIWVLFVC